MAIATLTTKGQITIPKIIRETLKLNTGDKVEIVLTKEGEAIIRPISKKVDDIFGKLHRPEREAVSLETMKKAVQNRMKDKFSEGD